MLVRDLMTKNVISCKPETPISEIISKMRENNIHQIPMISSGDRYHIKGEVVGSIVLNRIITHVSDPTKTMAKNVALPTPKLHPDDSIERTAELILGSNLRAIPVYDRKIRGIISEQDIMKAISIGGIASDVAKPCISVKKDASLGKVKEGMIQKDISRVVIVENGNVLGVVGTMDLIKIIPLGAERYEARAGRNIMKGNRGFMEPHRLDDIPLINVIHNSPIVSKDESLQNIAKLLQTNEEVLVRGFPSGGYGIITHKDILRVWISERKRAVVIIEGLDHEDETFDISKIQQKAAQIVLHISGSGELQPMKIHIKQQRKQGLKMRYSVKIELPTSMGLFVSEEESRKDKSFGNLTGVVQKALEDLERQLKKKQDKFRKPDRGFISVRRAEKEEGISIRTED